GTGGADRGEIERFLGKLDAHALLGKEGNRVGRWREARRTDEGERERRDPMLHPTSVAPAGGRFTGKCRGYSGPRRRQRRGRRATGECPPTILPPRRCRRRHPAGGPRLAGPWSAVCRPPS